jgi:hypothetical protein
MHHPHNLFSVRPKADRGRTIPNVWRLKCRLAQRIASRQRPVGTRKRAAWTLPESRKNSKPEKSLPKVAQTPTCLSLVVFQGSGASFVGQECKYNFCVYLCSFHIFCYGCHSKVQSFVSPKIQRLERTIFNFPFGNLS